jgi:hypothetical protein
MSSIDALRLARVLVAVGVWLVATCAFASPAERASALTARHAALEDQLTNNDFGRPLYIESVQNGKHVSGDVFARVPQGLAAVSSAMQQAANWCDVLIMVVNIKQCVVGGGPAAPALVVRIGRKSRQAPADAFQLQFQYRVLASSDDYLHVQLHADRGPLGTHQYQISFEAVALDAQRSFVHISYGYGQGLAARLATSSYLATAGSNKVGFSVVGRGSDGQPILVKHMRGIIERNAMRCYLAVEAYLGAQTVAEHLRVEKRLQDWYAATEQYARQLHELARDEYLELKRSEVAQQQVMQRTS